MLGGTRFVGKAFVKQLLADDHSVSLFTRGNQPVPEDVEHFCGDRHKSSDLSILKQRKFDVIADISGRTLDDTFKVLSFTGPPKHRFLYVSSAGVYEHSDIWPLTEKSPIDPNSRHIGKVETENWLIENQIPFTSFRPTYIYGPGNYNPIEKWFFDRIVNERPIPLPGDGNTITQLGHVSDLAQAMATSISSDKANNRIYNCSGLSGITFSGLIKQCAKVCGKDPSKIQTISFDMSRGDLKKRKCFPLRLSHFLTDITLLCNEIEWKPKYTLTKGLEDSFINDYSMQSNSVPDFTLDEQLFGV